VKQGGVLSPVLYLLYIDGLLIKLTKSGMGCFFDPFFVGALAYAGNLALLAPTATAMRKLFSIWDDYGKEFSIEFNAKKSKWLAIIPKKRRWLRYELHGCQFHIGGNHIDSVVICSPWTCHK